MIKVCRQRERERAHERENECVCICICVCVTESDRASYGFSPRSLCDAVVVHGTLSLRGGVFVDKSREDKSMYREGCVIECLSQCLSLLSGIQDCR